MIEVKVLTDKEWLRITQVHELVKQEGDSQCEAAFDDLIRAHNLLKKMIEDRSVGCKNAG